MYCIWICNPCSIPYHLDLGRPGRQDQIFNDIFNDVHRARFIPVNEGKDILGIQSSLRATLSVIQSLASAALYNALAALSALYLLCQKTNWLMVVDPKPSRTYQIAQISQVQPI